MLTSDYFIYVIDLVPSLLQSIKVKEVTNYDFDSVFMTVKNSVRTFKNLKKVDNF